MPEKEITEEQVEAVKEWISEQSGSWRHSFNEGIMFSRVYEVESEPLMIHGVTQAIVRPPVGAVRYTILCSRRLASQLETAGVIRFSPEPQQGAQTP